MVYENSITYTTGSNKTTKDKNLWKNKNGIATFTKAAS